MKKIAFVTGMTGQDGPYLAKHLLEHDYKVYGLVKRYSNPNLANLEYLKIENDVELITGDVTDDANMNHLVKSIRPNEFYNLAAQSFVPASFDQPLLTSEVTALGALRLLEAIRQFDTSIRYYQASSSEMFGRVQQEPQNEMTPFWPRSPYGVAKVYAHWITINYRESYGIFACNGILFNHESPWRGKEFVTRKISDAVARIKLGRQKTLCLGNLDAQRDWGFAGDYVQAMWRILNHKTPDDFVIATGVKHSVLEFAELAFEHADMDFREFVEVDPGLLRPADVHTLCGDASKARSELKWEPKVDFRELVGMMVEADLARLNGEWRGF